MIHNETIDTMMKPMDDGYLVQGYYSRQKVKIPIEDGRPDIFTFDDYSWTEHISRKWGQWVPSSADMLKALRDRGFDIGATSDNPGEKDR